MAEEEQLEADAAAGQAEEADGSFEEDINRPSTYTIRPKFEKK